VSKATLQTLVAIPKERLDEMEVAKSLIVSNPAQTQAGKTEEGAEPRQGHQKRCWSVKVIVQVVVDMFFCISRSSSAIAILRLSRRR